MLNLNINPTQIRNTYAAAEEAKTNRDNARAVFLTTRTEETAAAWDAAEAIFHAARRAADAARAEVLTALEAIDVAIDAAETTSIDRMSTAKTREERYAIGQALMQDLLTLQHHAAKVDLSTAPNLTAALNRAHNYCTINGK